MKTREQFLKRLKTKDDLHALGIFDVMIQRSASVSASPRDKVYAVLE
jgi:hypothetical protein